ncbi:MAG: DUF2490 domain-containing protein [Reyranella sp.]|nr:DUF2490 domain-containing protein [Reyranella sp.]
MTRRLRVPEGWRFPRAAATLACLLSTMLGAAPAAAQRQSPSPARGPMTPNGDLWLVNSVGIEYDINPQWAFHFDAQLQLDRDVSRLRELEVRPGFEYAFAPNLAIAAGYVQYQRYPTGMPSRRGPFEDMLYRTRFGPVAFAGRLRTEELFYDNTAVLIRTRPLAGVRIPIGESPWEFAVSEEVFIDLKVDRTGHQTGIHHNKAYAGFGRPITAQMKLSAGYELDTYERNGTFRNVQQIRLGVVYRLN